MTRNCFNSANALAVPARWRRKFPRDCRSKESPLRRRCRSRATICSASGIRASAKANRSRNSTGDEWWLKPMTTRFMDDARRKAGSCPRMSAAKTRTPTMTPTANRRLDRAKIRRAINSPDKRSQINADQIDLRVGQNRVCLGTRQERPAARPMVKRIKPANTERGVI